MYFLRKWSEFDAPLPGAQQTEASMRAFLKRSMPHMSQQTCEDQLQHKTVVLEYSTHQKRKEKEKKKPKGLSARQRRELHLFDVKPEQQRYGLLSLYENSGNSTTRTCAVVSTQTHSQMIQAKLLKADLRGALLSVTKSKCASYVGVTGILLQEAKHVFKILTKDRLKVIPKLNCAYTVDIDSFISNIYGSKFQLVKLAIRQEIQSKGNS